MSSWSSDDHAGLKAAIREVLPEAVWQRCYVHFLRNALDYVPRKVDDDCLRELRWFYDRRELAEVRRDIAAWLAKWQSKYPKLCAWAEENIEETLSYYRLPLPHHKHMKSTNMLERLNQEIKRRTHVVRIFPNPESCLRLVRALAVEMHEKWLEAMRYLNMEHLREHKKQMRTQTLSAASVFTGGGPAYMLALMASTPPRTKAPRQKRTVSSRTRNTSAIRALVQPSSVNSMVRARSASPRSRDPARVSSAARCPSLALTGDLPAMSRPRESLRRRNHSRNSLVKFKESA